MSAVLAVTLRDAEAEVRILLREWVAYRRGWNPHIGHRSAVPWIDHVDGAVDSWADGDDYDAKIRAVRMRHVDEAVNALASDHRHAVFVIYLREAGPAVWRSARKTMKDIRALCTEAEQLLVNALRRRFVL